MLARAKSRKALYLDSSFSIVVVICLSIACSTICQGEDIILNFNNASLPSALGWTYESQCFPNFPGGVNLSESEAVDVGGGVLSIDTTTPSTTEVNASYQIRDQVDSTEDFLFEARLRVLSLEAAPPSTAQAISLDIFVDGFFYQLQVGDGEVLTSDSSPGVAVDTSVFHVYSILHKTGISSYSILLDGDPVLTADRDPTALLYNQLRFGDVTCQSRNGSVEVDLVKFRPVRIFSDGFESGNLVAWSSSVP
jgi:hypothetical protein